MKNIVLDNGIRILLHPMANTHSVTVGLYIKAGQMYGEPKVGITHFLEHLHFRQMGSVSQKNLYYKMERIGSTLRATTYRDFLKFSMKVHPRYFNECIEIFADLINAKEWSDDNFKKERKVVLNQISESGHFISIDHEVRKSVFIDHPLSLNIMGSQEQLSQITLKDVLDYKRQTFNTSNLLICITGNFSPVDVDQTIQCFKKCNITSQISTVQTACPKAFHQRKPSIKFICIEDENPLEVNLSYDITYAYRDKDYLTILNCILGEGVGSRLQTQIREEKCFTSDISSYIEWYHNFAVLHIRFSVERKYLLPCIEDINRILNDIKYNITRKDLDVSLPFYTTNKDFDEDDTEEMNYQLAYHRLIFQNDYKAVDIQNTQLSAFKLQGMAQNIFVSNNLCVVVVGNTKRITKKSIVQILGQGDGLREPE